jgi:hypothetical protein
MIVGMIKGHLTQDPMAMRVDRVSYGRNLWMSSWHESAAYLPP